MLANFSSLSKVKKNFMKRLLLHIGTGKTGTSSIQNFLYENRSRLADDFGVYYPEFGLSATNHFGEIIHAHYPVVNWITRRRLKKLRAVVKELKSAGCELSILSCENFYHHFGKEDMDYVAEIFSDFKIEIVCYVRRQDLYMESAWKQQVKVGTLKGMFADFLQRHINAGYLGEVHANYYRMLKIWAAVFGLDAIHLKVFDKSEWINGDLIDDFLVDLCSLENNTARFQLVKPQKVNAALPSELIRLVQKVNQSGLIEQSEQEEFVKYLSGLTSFHNNPLLSKADRIAIIQNYTECNQELFSEFAGREVPPCFLGDAIAKEPDQAPTSDIESLAVRALVGSWKQIRNGQGNDLLSKTQPIGKPSSKTSLLRLKPLASFFKVNKKQKIEAQPELPWTSKITGPIGYSPELKPIQIVRLIKQHLSTKTPLSIIRLGDGEGEVIGYPEYIPPEIFESRLRVYFGKHVISKQHREIFIQEVRDAVKHADVIGAPPGSEVTNYTAVRFFLEHYQLVKPDAKIASLSLHRNLQELGLYKDILYGLDELGIVTCRDVEDPIKQIFNIKNILVYKIPEDVKRAKDKNAVERHFPERFEQLRATLQVPKPGMLFLVGGGALGKVYCRWIKERGGIALDIGSIFDAWAGLNTRKYMNNDDGGLKGIYELNRYESSVKP